MPFRATRYPAKRAALVRVGLFCLWAALTGCASDTTGSAASTRPPDPVVPVPGIAPTRADHIPPGAAACVVEPNGDGDATLAIVSDPDAPRITISVPPGWNSTPGTGDLALLLSGPDTLAATVTIAVTDQPAETAFLRHTSAVGGAMPRLKFSVTGSPFCGYSSQQLSGTLQGPAGGIDFADRVTHIWTNTKLYLVTIHLEAHSGAPGFTAARAALTQDFAVVIP